MSSFDDDFFIKALERNPSNAVREAQRVHLPKRFYTDVGLAEEDGNFAILLDGKRVKTQGRATLAAPSRVIANALAAEWAVQVDTIKPATMPLTRLVNVAIDAVDAARDAVAADIVKYAGSDLVCYRADEPDALAAAQTAAWDPVLAFAAQQLGARFDLAGGIVFVTQPPAASAAIAKAVDAIAHGSHGALRLTALHSITTLTGSALIALALAHGALSVDAAWNAAHVDEDYQMNLWGMDAEAVERRNARFVDMQAAALLLSALK